MKIKDINWTKEILSGVYASFLVICFTQAAVVLIFSGQLSAYLPFGLAGGLLGVTIVNLFYGLTSRIPYSLATTSPSLAAILILMTAQIHSNTTPEQFIPTALAAIILMTMVIGLTMYIFGTSGLVRFLRFTPYPVIGGFMAVTAWMMLLGSRQVMQQDLAQPALNFLDLLLKNWLGLVFGVLIFSGIKFIKNKYAYIMLILGAILAVHLFLIFSGINHNAATQQGYFLSNMNISFMASSWNYNLIENINWKEITNQANYFTVVAISGILIQTFRLSTLEETYISRTALNREMTACGQAILVSGLFGGVLATPSVPVNYLLQRLGIRTVIPTVITIILVIALIYGTPNLLSFMPKSIIVGLIIFSALEVFYEWLYLAIWRLPVEDYLVVFSILVVAIFFGFMISIAFGIIVASAIFLVKYSQTNNIKYQLTGKEIKSKYKYSVSAEQYLRAMGIKTLVIKLQGYLFFGSSRTLLEDQQSLLKKSPKGTYVNLILDFQLVTGLDTSAVVNFFTLGKVANSYGVNFILSNCSDKIKEQFSSMTTPQWLQDNVKFVPNLDYALESCERDFLNENPEIENKDLYFLFDDPKKQDLFLSYWDQKSLEPNTYLFRQNDSSHSLYFIVSGKVTAYIEGPQESNIRLFTTESRVLLGEMAFFSDSPRSATAITETTCIIYELTRMKLKDIQANHPELVTDFYKSIIHLLSERIGELNHDIELFRF